MIWLEVFSDFLKQIEYAFLRLNNKLVSSMNLKVIYRFCDPNQYIS